MVNVQDFGPQPEVSDKLEVIFSRQHELMLKYHEIEKGNGFYVPAQIPLDLNNPHDQHKFKDFAWRITEELGEALEAERRGHKVHTDEELSDALHFLVEGSIMVGYRPSITMEQMYILWEPEGTAFTKRNYACLAYRTGVVIDRLGVACNCLKNKPWKQTHMKTDEDYFMGCMTNVWVAFIQLIITAGIGEYDLYDLYFRKSEVNKFRQRSEY